MSYGQLWKRTSEIHCALAALPRRNRGEGLPRDLPLFALSAGNHPVAAEFLATAFGRPCCVGLLDPAWPGARQAEIIERLSPDIVICVSDEAEEAAGSVPVLRADDRAQYEQWLSNAAGPSRAGVPGNEDPFLIGFTSGTTSMPKAFLRNRGSWRASATAGRNRFSLDSRSHTLAPGPLAHGLTLYAFMETLEAGASFYGLPNFDSEAMWALLSKAKPDRLVGVPTMLEVLCRTSRERGERLPFPRRITTAGAKLEPDLLRGLSNMTDAEEVTEYYGASELGFVTTAKYVRDAAGQLRIAANGAGTAFPGVAISVRENGAALDARREGMIFVKSELAIDGYLFGGDGTGLRRDGDWVSVGDMGRLDRNGRLKLLGRSGGMVITGGYNVYPDEIAACLRRSPDVAGAVVLGIADRYLGQMLVAVIKFSPGRLPTAKDLASDCETGLPRYKIPRKFFAVDDWPMTSSGKIATGTVTKWIEANDEGLKPL